MFPELNDFFNSSVSHGHMFIWMREKGVLISHNKSFPESCHFSGMAVIKTEFYARGKLYCLSN
jgi:hypothetical protein